MLRYLFAAVVAMSCWGCENSQSANAPSTVQRPQSEIAHAEELPLVGQAHDTDSSGGILDLELPAEFALPGVPKLQWTFYTSATSMFSPQVPADGPFYAVWLNDELIYHNRIAPPRWMPEVRSFESEPLIPGNYRLVVKNMNTGAMVTHEFTAEDTKAIVIYDQYQRPLNVRSFHIRRGFL